MDARNEKLIRLREGGRPRVLDLFAGCGGLSLGFQSVGFEIVGAVEVDPIAARSYAANFFKNAPGETQNLYARPRDITKVDPADLVSEVSPGSLVEHAVDVVIGGPPCQAFARIGRAKLREVASHPQAYLHDHRGALYLRYLHYVERLQPLALLMENVPDVLNYGGNNIAHQMCQALTEMGYICSYTILNAAYYGVPQMRERVFLLAYANELGAEPSFPSPTHWLQLPLGYEGVRRVALKALAMTEGRQDSYFCDAPEPEGELLPAVTVEEAIGDLPRLTCHLEGKLKRGPKRFTGRIPYPDDVPLSAYARIMRGWPGFENNDGVVDHVIRYLPRDYPIFQRMKPGDQYPEAYEHALKLFEEELARMNREGVEIQPYSREWNELRRRIVPPYDSKKFPNKWRKMEPDRPARTLMAHLGKDSYSHIHYDSCQARTISVREAARLQSFPDGFVFEGAMGSAFRQIGNAVPPLLAAAIARKMLSALRGHSGSEINWSCCSQLPFALPS